MTEKTNNKQKNKKNSFGPYLEFAFPPSFWRETWNL